MLDHLIPLVVMPENQEAVAEFSSRGGGSGKELLGRQLLIVGEDELCGFKRVHSGLLPDQSNRHVQQDYCTIRPLRQSMNLPAYTAPDPVGFPLNEELRPAPRQALPFDASPFKGVITHK